MYNLHRLRDKNNKSTLIDTALYHEPHPDKLSAEKAEARNHTYDKIIFALGENGPLTEYSIHKQTRISRNNIILAKRLRVLTLNNLVFEHCYSLPTPSTKTNSRGAYTWTYYMANVSHPLAANRLIYDGRARTCFNLLYEPLKEGENDNKILERIEINDEVQIKAFGVRLSDKNPLDRLVEYRSRKAELDKKIGDKAIELFKVYMEKYEKLESNIEQQIMMKYVLLDMFIHLKVQGIIPDNTYLGCPYTYFDLWKWLENNNNAGLLDFAKATIDDTAIT